MVPSFNFIPAWLIFKQPLGARAAAALRAATALVPKGTPSFHTASRHANRVDGSADNRTTPFSRRTSASITVPSQQAFGASHHAVFISVSSAVSELNDPPAAYHTTKRVTQRNVGCAQSEFRRLVKIARQRVPQRPT